MTSKGYFPHFEKYHAESVKFSLNQASLKKFLCTIPDISGDFNLTKCNLN